MIDREKTRHFIEEQRKLYPLAGAQDMYKALYQSTFGNGHLIKDASAAESYMMREANESTDVAAELLEDLDGDYVRVHIGLLRDDAEAIHALTEAFVKSAGIPAGSVEDFRERLSVLVELMPEARAEMEEREAGGFEACHHSEVFRDTYHPAYRVLHRSCLDALGSLYERK